MNALLQISAELRDAVNKLNFASPISHVYNPLEYAWQTYASYIEKFGNGNKKVLLLGMNPGPYGMAQTGVPFGDIIMVRDWMGIYGDVKKPVLEHPKRIIDGFACKRREGSGKRLWDWAQQEFGTADNFFKSFFVINYCPLLFFSIDGKNITPDKLPKLVQNQLHEICNNAASKTISVLNPVYTIGVGNYAADRLRTIVNNPDIVVDSIIHPSPASPLANRGWSEQVNAKLHKIGVL